MTAADAPAERLAAAKVNLTLHLRGQRADGYHLLESLVVFPRLGDGLSVEPANGLSLSIGGPFGDGLSTGADNLVLKAAEGLARRHGVSRGAALHLKKNLPVASGIGGGSSDAATALRLLAEAWGVDVPDDLALWLGADVPVCCQAPAPQIMSGIGERLRPAPRLPDMHILLVNPLVGVPTGAVFAGVADKCPDLPPDPPPEGFSDFDASVGWLATQRNDLQAAAVAICPPIGEVLSALSEAPVARMSGSGATCFALYPDQAAADAIADHLRAQTGWWVASAPVPGNQGQPLNVSGV